MDASSVITAVITGSIHPLAGQFLLKKLVLLMDGGKEHAECNTLKIWREGAGIREGFVCKIFSDQIRFQNQFLKQYIGF